MRQHVYKKLSVGVQRNAVGYDLCLFLLQCCVAAHYQLKVPSKGSRNWSCKGVTVRMCVDVQGAGAVELVPWPHADQAHEWAQSIQSDFSLPMQVAWTRLSDVSNLHYHTEVSTASLQPEKCVYYTRLRGNRLLKHSLLVRSCLSRAQGLTALPVPGRQGHPPFARPKMAVFGQPMRIDPAARQFAQQPT